MRTAVLAAALLTVPLLAGCGGDDDDDVASSSATTEAAADEGDDAEDIPDADAQAVVDAVQLEEADLGEGWTLTDTQPPDDGDDDSSDEDDPVAACFDTDIDEHLKDAKVAESDERTFTQDSNGAPLSAQVISSAVVLDDDAPFSEMHDALQSDEFEGCLTDAFAQQMDESAPGSEVTLGEIESGPAVDPDEYPDVDSTALTIPLTVATSGISIDIVMSISVIDQGNVGALLFVFGPGDQPLAEKALELSGVLASRMPA